MAVTVQVPNKSEILTPILDYQRIRDYSAVRPPDAVRLDEILAKARELKGLEDFEAAQLMAIDNPDGVEAVLRTAAFVKEEIYGVRMVLFAPIYVGNKCANDCLYCGFRSENKDLRRVTLSTAELEDETRALLRQGHKRLLLLTGESRSYNVEFTMRALETIYGVEENGAGIRRINVEVAPMSVEDFRVLKSGRIGTYTCFQETYDPSLYKTYHQRGPKADYGFRLSVMDRAMEAGIDDVGVGVLFGLAPWKQEVISLLNHARHLDKRWGCGPHTISVPRLEPAPGAPLTRAIPYPVSDAEFRLIVAVLRLTVPYTGIILSTRESKAIRDDLFRYGVSQASAGSKTTPGAYNKGNGKTPVGEYTHSQFSLADHRSLHEVVSDLVDGGFVPSFCTGCYRQGRTGADFMDLAKPGLIKRYCLPMVSQALPNTWKNTPMKPSENVVTPLLTGWALKTRIPSSSSESQPESRPFRGDAGMSTSSDVQAMSRDEAMALFRDRRLKPLAAEAGRITKQSFGSDVYLRGLIEYSNYCGVDCLYCGIRRTNTFRSPLPSYHIPDTRCCSSRVREGAAHVCPSGR